MKQFTVKRALQAWYWIHNNPHHEVAMEYHPRTGQHTHTWFRNHHQKMRVPKALCEEVFAGIKPNRRKFDTRMYALKPAAKLRVTR